MSKFVWEKGDIKFSPRPIITFPTYAEMEKLDGPQILERLLDSINARLMNLRTAIKYADKLFLRTVINGDEHGMITTGLRNL